MALPKPREGDALGFMLHGRTSHELTLGEPERIIWSSIRHLCSRDVAERILYIVHGIRAQTHRSKIARNIKLYIEHAHEFYEAGQFAKANTAPLFYYYSFLNLAKALGEIAYPGFHKRPESYRHGVSWRPNPSYLVSVPSESVSLTTRGVWHVLWECVVGQRCPAANPTQIRIKDLFALCPEVGVEYSRIFLQEIRLVDLLEPNIMGDEKRGNVWIKFSIDRESIQKVRISGPALLNLLNQGIRKYRRVLSENRHVLTFELVKAKTVSPRFKGSIYDLLSENINQLNLFTHLGYGELSYFFPIQTSLALRFPQILVLYTLMFWLGSLVRYDPHSISDLRESQYWILIDGFMNQSRIWLLELFEWELYKAETTLLVAR